MDHRDAQMTEVVVVLNGGYDDRLAEAVEQLRAAGMTVDSTDDENGTVRGTIEAYRVPAVEAMACVHFVRSTMTYIADFPSGDPRDADGAEEDAEPAEG